MTNAITEESQEENLTEFNEWGRAIRNNANYMHEVSLETILTLFLQKNLYAQLNFTEFFAKWQLDLGISTNL